MLGSVLALAVAAGIVAWFVLKRRKHSKGSNDSECWAFNGYFVDLAKINVHQTGYLPEKSSYAHSF